MYTSHRTKEIVGGRIVLCPTIATTECKSCHRKGHTANHCPEREKATTTFVMVKPPAEKKRVIESSAPVNQFSVLMDSSDSEEEVIVEMGARMETRVVTKTVASWYDSDDE
jgi:hypothetical protein